MDYKHQDLASVVWTNPNPQTEVAETIYKNDTHGWNFAENNNQVIDYKYLGTFSADCTKIFEVQGKILHATATEAEKAWYKSKKEDQTFLKELQKFGNFVHGTHVSGISSHESPENRLVALKLIPTEPPGIGIAKMMRTYAESRPDNPMAKLFISMLAKQQAKLLITAGECVAAVKSDVANGSFGTSVAAVKPVLAGLLKTFLGHEPTDEELKDYAIFFVEQIAMESKAFIEAASSTLFVFAAGNDGTDNDTLPVSPANIKAANSIAVAATMGVSSLAPFSNFGANLVEVAAPGVVIRSTIPGDQYLEMSGTSMAAPFVTNVAGLVKDANKALSPTDVKQILMETVDKKDFLSGKVKTSGIVNRERAVRAALLSQRESLSAAIAQARYQVADAREELELQVRNAAENLIVLPLPSPF